MRARSVIVLTLAGVFVAALAAMAWMHGQRAEVQARLDVFLADLERRNAVPVGGREAVYGATLDGDAAEHYVAAARQLEPHGLSAHAIDAGRELLQRDPPLSPAVRAQLAPSLAAALSSLRSGVRCSRRSRGAKYDRALLAAVVGDAVDQAFAAREVDEAVELFVDQCVYTLDAYGDPGLPPFRDEWLRQLDASSGAFLAGALRRLDERWPRVEPPEEFVAHVIRMCATRGLFDQSFMDGIESYEFGFDAWWRELVRCEELLARLPELSPPAERWSQRQAQFTAFGATSADAQRGVATVLPAVLSRLERLKREQLAKLRMLRLAVAFVCGHELPQLDDPLGGGAIEVQVRGDEATFRSEGMEGETRIERTVRRR